MTRPSTFLLCLWSAASVCLAQTPSADQPAVIRQGDLSTPLTAHPQTVRFVKSGAADSKTAVANLLITQVGIPLLTMGLSSQMRMWNPYMNEALTKGLNLGKGILMGHGSETPGFEYEMLRGVSAPVSLQRGVAEFRFQMDQFLDPADLGDASLEPILLRVEARNQDQARLLCSRRVSVKETKKGRFDLHPSTEREEKGVDQSTIPVDVAREDAGVWRIAPREELTPGEYALVFRKHNANVALRPTGAPLLPGDLSGTAGHGLRCLGLSRQ